jgi:translation initiation factor 3 subunit A
MWHLQAHKRFSLLCIERRAEEQQRLDEEAAVAAEAERKKREEEEKLLAVRKEREAERAAALEKARLQQQREEEAEARRQARKEGEKASARKPIVAPSAVRANGGDPAWRRDTPANSVTPTPSRAANASEPSQRPESPSPAAVPKYRPGALSGGWRAREDAKAKDTATAVPARVAGTASPRPSSPALPAKEEPKPDDGFQTVRGGGVWRGRRGRS